MLREKHEEYYIKCSLCHSRVCVDCVLAIYNKISTVVKEPDDTWYQNVKNFLENGIAIDDVSFVGHCCEVRQQIEKCVKTKQYSEINHNELQHDGFLHIPQLHILIPPPIRGWIDVHGLGAEDQLDIPGLIHGVFGYETANICSKKL